MVPRSDLDEGVDEPERFFNSGVIAVAPPHIPEQDPVANSGDQLWHSLARKEAQHGAFVAKETRYALQPRCSLGSRH